MKRIFVLSISVGLFLLALWAPATTVQSADTARVVFYVA
jgi:hypothetical protein